MNDSLLDDIFAAISRLRSAELLLMSRGDTDGAEKVRKSRKMLSRARDRLICIGMDKAAKGATEAAAELAAVNSHLQAYLSERQKADNRLKSALEALSVLLGLLAAGEELVQ